MTKNQMLALKPGDKVRALCKIPALYGSFLDNGNITPGSIISVVKHTKHVHLGIVRDCVSIPGSTWAFEEEIEKV